MANETNNTTMNTTTKTTENNTMNPLQVKASPKFLNILMECISTNTDAASAAAAALSHRSSVGRGREFLAETCSVVLQTPNVAPALVATAKAVLEQRAALKAAAAQRPAPNVGQATFGFASAPVVAQQPISAPQVPAVSFNSAPAVQQQVAPAAAPQDLFASFGMQAPQAVAPVVSNGQTVYRDQKTGEIRRILLDGTSHPVYEIWVDAKDSNNIQLRNRKTGKIDMSVSMLFWLQKILEVAGKIPAFQAGLARASKARANQR